jgi:uncharacterized membrane protein HdeD (DUF308 family)
MSVPEEVRMTRPPFDAVAFVFGALFVLVAVLGLLGPAFTRRLDLGVVFPVALVIIGAAVLAGALRPRRSGSAGTGAGTSS